MGAPAREELVGEFIEKVVDAMCVTADENGLMIPFKVRQRFEAILIDRVKVTVEDRP